MYSEATPHDISQTSKESCREKDDVHSGDKSPELVLMNPISFDQAPENAFIDSLRLQERDRLAILRQMQPRIVPHDKRFELRFGLENGPVMFLTINQPGGSVGRFRVRPRNISTMGMGFLHGSFLHHRTECSIVGRSLDREPVCVTGRVVRCHHVRSHIHDVGVKFDYAVDLHIFLTPAQLSCGAESAVTAQPPWRAQMQTRFDLLGKRLALGDSAESLAREVEKTLDELKKLASEHLSSS